MMRRSFAEGTELSTAVPSAVCRFLVASTCGFLLGSFGLARDATAGVNANYVSLLSVSGDVRTLGMVAAIASNGSGPTAAWGNPALLGLEDRASFLALPSADWPFEGLSLENYALAVPLWAIRGRRPVLAVGYRRRVLEFEGIPVRTAFVDSELFSLRLDSWSTLVSTGIAVSPGLSAGGAVRITDLGDHDNRYAFDVGVLAHRPFFEGSRAATEGRLGVVVRNMGSDASEELPLPAKTNDMEKADVYERVGVLGGQTPEELALAGGAIHQAHRWNLEAALELVKRIYPNAPPKWYQHYGGELEVFDLVALRLGYVNDQYSNDVTYGFGVHIPVRLFEFSLDYARRPDPYENTVYGARMDFWSFGVAYAYP